MNWFSELCDLYDKNMEQVGKIEYLNRKGKEQIPLVLLPVFHTTVAAQITVNIDTKGNFLGAVPVANADKLTIIPVTEYSGSRTAGVEAHPFCDNLKYLAGDYMEYMPPGEKDCSRNHELYMEGLEAWHLSQFTHRKVDALYAYLKKGALVGDLVACGVLLLDESGKLSLKEKIQIVSQTDAFVRFRIIEELENNQNILNDPSGKYYSECWLDRTLQEAYIEYCRSVMDERGLCYLTGEQAAISYLQPKKIRNEGDGSKLISSNDEQNFTFRGRFADKREAFAVGYEASQKAHNALKWIIRKQGDNRDGLCMVIWESDLRKLPEWSANTDEIYEAYEGWGEESGEKQEEYEGTGGVTAAKFRAAMRGYGTKLGADSRTMLLAFDAATPGRLAMTENKEFETSRYLDNIAYWHDTCRWLQLGYKDGHPFTYIGMAGIRDIAEALYGTEQNGKLSLSGKSRMYAQVCKRLLPCVSERKKVPQDMVMTAVYKASSPVSYTNRYHWEKVLSIACSLVKKERMERKKEEWEVALNETSKDRNYLYGRLLAAADRIEYVTYDKEKDAKRVTNARRLMSAFAQHPYQTWTILEERINPYLQKMDMRQRNFYDKIMDEIYNLFEEEKFVENSKLEGLYLLGYHSQMYALKYKEKETEEAAK